MAKTIIDCVLVDGRAIIADRRRRLRGDEAVDPLSYTLEDF